MAVEDSHKHWIKESSEPGLVSVIIPTYNRADMVIEAMNSIWAQTYRPIELIVVDDGSTDDTTQVITRWGEEHKGDGFDLYYIRQPNQGAPVARNAGLIQSRGEYIQFLDSDDRLSSSKIAAQMAKSREYPNHVLHGPWRLFKVQDDKVLVGALNSPEGGNYPFAQGDYIRAWCAGFEPPHCFLWPRTWVRSIGPWDETLACNQDLDFLGRGFLAGIRLVYVDQSVAYYRMHEGGRRISGSLSPRHLESMLRVTQKMEDGLRHLGIWEEYRDSLAIKYYEIARKSAVFYPRYYKMALHWYNVLRNPGVKRPGTTRHQIMADILGVRGAETLSYLMRKTGISMHTIPMILRSNYKEMEQLDMLCDNMPRTETSS